MARRDLALLSVVGSLELAACVLLLVPCHRAGLAAAAAGWIVAVSAVLVGGREA